MISRFLRSSYRIPGFLLLCSYYGLGMVKVKWKTQQDPKAMHDLFLRFIASVHNLMGIRVFQEGELPEEPSILMGNHRSYVDAVLIPAKRPVAFVARIESKSWPIIGWSANTLHTIWVQRKSKESRKETRNQVKQRLIEGFGIVIFPEGTTHKGPELLEYRPSMFYISAEGGFPITPIAIEYRDPNIAWVDKQMFIPHAWKHFGKKHMDIRVSIGKTIKGTDGQELLDKAHQWTQSEVYRLRALWDSENNQ
jgi:1-acyl-sn-glycerol-3-phosphate acyltransferase